MTTVDHPTSHRTDCRCPACFFDGPTTKPAEAEQTEAPKKTPWLTWIWIAAAFSMAGACAVAMASSGGSSYTPSPGSSTVATASPRIKAEELGSYRACAGVWRRLPVDTKTEDFASAYANERTSRLSDSALWQAAHDGCVRGLILSP